MIIFSGTWVSVIVIVLAVIALGVAVFVLRPSQTHRAMWPWVALIALIVILGNSIGLVVERRVDTDAVTEWADGVADRVTDWVQPIQNIADNVQFVMRIVAIAVGVILLLAGITLLVKAKIDKTWSYVLIIIGLLMAISNTVAFIFW